jgi:hypothetical protein
MRISALRPPSDAILDAAIAVLKTAVQPQASGLGNAQRSRAPLLTAHAHLAARCKRDARELFK